MSKIEVPR